MLTVNHIWKWNILSNFLLTHNSHVSYVVPDISLLFIIGHQGQSPLKRGQSHIVLLGVETAQAQVVVQLAIIHSHLEQPSSNGWNILNHRWKIKSHQINCNNTLHKLYRKFVWPIEAQSNLRLICIEVIAAYAGYGLHVSVVLLQDVFIVLCRWWNVVHLLSKYHFRDN